MNYQWKIKHQYDGNFIELIKKDKNFSDSQMDSFIDVKSSKFRNPNLLPNINRAIARTQQAIDNQERIMIAGDYDCDGVTATASMVIGLSSMTPNVEWTVPKRSDGYGLSKKIIDEAIEKKIDLIITVDNGIAAHEAIDYANENNIEVIVTDHHQHLTETLPKGIVVDPYIDAFYPFKRICGCMVAFKFLQMLIPNFSKTEVFKEIVALTTFATIADAMALLDENRKFVTNGLQLLNTAKHISYGIDALINGLKMTRGNITSTDVAFYIAPCINAVGRVEDAEMAVRLFLADDEVTADNLAQKAIKLNNHRKYLQKKVLDKTEVDKDSSMLVEVIDEVPAGILGILAGNFASKYQKPCFVLHNDNGKLTGSGRTVADFDISSCVSQSFDICNGGGHKAACGVTLMEENLPEFKKRCASIYSEWLETATDVVHEPTMEFICDMNFNYIDDNLMRLLALLSPFGQGNKEPQFCTLNVEVADYRILGKTENAVKFDFVHNGIHFDGICFNALKDKYIDELKAPQKVDIGFTLQYNCWAGRQNIQLMLVDIREHK